MTALRTSTPISPTEGKQRKHKPSSFVASLNLPVPLAAGRQVGVIEPDAKSLRGQRGSGGNEASVAKRNTVVERNSSPGFSSVDGKFGLFGLSGKCCVSSVNASV